MKIILGSFSRKSNLKNDLIIEVGLPSPSAKSGRRHCSLARMAKPKNKKLNFCFFMQLVRCIVLDR